MKILAINPGSTSTKIGIFNGEKQVAAKTIRHSADELAAFPSLIDQLDFRKKLIEETIAEEGMELSGFDGIIGRGGLLRPIESGVYAVNDAMIHDLRIGLQGIHASNLGGLLACSLVKGTGREAYIADPVVVDELSDEARVTGHPLFKKVCIFHALNHKAIARKHCMERGLDYEKVNLIVAHMGGGVSVAIHSKGKVIDVNNALDGEGPFSPERCGTVPIKTVVELCFSGEYDKQQVLSMIQPKGGLVAYFGTNEFKEVMEMRATNEKAVLITDAMLLKIVREIGACAAVVDGNVDAILLTGGMAYSSYFVDRITEKTRFIAEVCAYPGEDELWALASALLRVLSGKEQPKVY